MYTAYSNLRACCLNKAGAFSMTMDRKQRKAKKREDKIRRKRELEAKKKSEGVSEVEKKSGKVQLIVFGLVALAGALLIILNV